MIDWQQERDYFRKLYLKGHEQKKDLELVIMSLPNDIKANNPDFDDETIRIINYHVTKILEKCNEEN